MSTLSLDDLGFQFLAVGLKQYQIVPVDGSLNGIAYYQAMSRVTGATADSFPSCAVDNAPEFDRIDGPTVGRSLNKPFVRIDVHELARLEVVLRLRQPDTDQCQDQNDTEQRVAHGSPSNLYVGTPTIIHPPLNAHLKENSRMKITPVRIQRRRTKGYDMQAESRAINGLPAKSVTRPGPWGNPYGIERFGLDLSLALFNNTVHGIWNPMLLKSCSDELCEAAYTAHNTFLKRLHPHPLELIRSELRGHNLACYCALPKPGEPDQCHAAIYLPLANQGFT
jgi:hypothetical protein